VWTESSVVLDQFHIWSAQLVANRRVTLTPENQIVWSTADDDHIVWGNCASAEDDHIVWGNCSSAADDHIVWGNWLPVSRSR